jgi:hypothetical protein
MRFYLSLYLLVAGFYLLTASGRIGRMSDSTAMFHVAQSIINEGSLSSEPCDPRYDDAEIGPLCVPGTGGRFYTAYGLVPSFMILPAILCAKPLSTVFHVNSLLIAKANASFFTLLVAALICVVLAMWISKLGYSRRTAILVACVLAFGSPFWQNSVSGFLSEPYFTLALLVAAYLLSTPRIGYACALSGFAFGVACGARIAGIIIFPAFILSLALQIRARKLTRVQFLRDALQFCVPLAVCTALIAWTNYGRFGSVFKTGYHIAFPTVSFTFSNPFFQGIGELLFHGEVGLLIFAPWVVLVFLCFPQFMRRHLPESVLCGGIFVANLLFYAKYQQWHGGWAGGPRYLIPTLPFLVMVIVPTVVIQRQVANESQRFWSVLHSLLVLLLAAGFIIQAITVAYPRDRYYAQFMFYRHKAVKPWWYGSIPLASIDYWFRTSIPKTEANGTGLDRSPTTAVVADEWAFADTASTEDEFIGLFPHPGNLKLPELMILKGSSMGLPAMAVKGYVIAVLIVILTGALGLKRYTRFQDSEVLPTERATDGTGGSLKTENSGVLAN